MPPPKENHAGRRPGIAAAMLRLFLLPALAFWMTSGCTVDLAADLTPAPYRPPVTSGEIANPDLAEASGMAASIRRPGCFWMVNDSGNGAVLHAVGPAGQHFGSVALAGAVGCTNIQKGSAAGGALGFPVPGTQAAGLLPRFQ